MKRLEPETVQPETNETKPNGTEAVNKKGRRCNITLDDVTKLADQRTHKENKNTNIGKDRPEEI